MAPSLKLNPNVIHLEYAVRGPIPQRAAEMARQGIPTIPCNIGNPQALGQRPLTYFRQVLSQTLPAVTLITTPPDFSAGSAEIDAHGVVIIEAHGLPFHCEPGLLRESVVLALP